MPLIEEVTKRQGGLEWAEKFITNDKGEKLTSLGGYWRSATVTKAKVEAKVREIASEVDDSVERLRKKSRNRLAED